MSKAKIILVLLTLTWLSATSATADPTRLTEESAQKDMGDFPSVGPQRFTSEFFFQPDANESILNIVPYYESGNRQQASPGQNWNEEFSSTALGLNFERGVSDLLTWKVHTSYGTDQNSYSSGHNYNYEGLSDILISARGFTPIYYTHLVYTLTFDVSPAAAQNATTSVNGNRFSGRQSVAPALGWEIRFSNQWLGGPFVNYEINGPRSTNVKNSVGNITSTSSLAGGNTLGAGLFGEFQHDRFATGVAAQMRSTEASTEIFDNGSVNHYDPTTYLYLDFYLAVNATDNLVFKPAVIYSNLLTSNYDGASLYTHNNLEFDLNFRVSL